MTPKMRKCLNYIKLKILENGYSPSYRQIERDVDCFSSVSEVFKVVNSLVDCGYLTKSDNKKCSIKLNYNYKPDVKPLLESLETNNIYEIRANIKNYLLNLDKCD